jgi:adenylylsulfate kinase
MTSADEKNLVWSPDAVTREKREERLGQRGCVLWFTGLSGSGKSTVGQAVEAALFARGNLAYRLDGDNVRHGLNSDLGFSREDRTENIRRIAEVAGLLADSGIIAISACISPFAADRAHARAVAGEGRFVEVYVKASLAACEKRDPKQLYSKARAGHIPEFTGISSPYEVPENPDLVVDTEALDVGGCASAVLEHMARRGLLA